ncbi:MAG TPA: hypothetical protein VEA59_00965 [Patescibacteria group bacterium]|nr:hypothetical protein [Patescibacteria group bacterium]
MIYKTLALVCLITFLSAGCNENVIVVTKPPISKPEVVPTETIMPSQMSEQPTVQSKNSRPLQFVVLSFDGSYSLPMWEDTLNFSQEMRIAGVPVRFTYFLSGVYFLNYRKAHRYHPPLKPVGTSLIGFADSNLDVERRVAYVNRAIAEGHEIGSHSNGHFSGAKWSKKSWEQEFSEFNNLLFSIDENNDVDTIDAERYRLHISPEEIVGYRAPELAKNSAMYEVLKKFNFAYDTSGTGKPEVWPQKRADGLWEFPLALIPYADTNSLILSMDYNFYYKQSKAKDVTKKGDELWNDFFEKTYSSYLNYFTSNYKGTRAPVYIGSHFSTWNDGVYWEAMKQFTKDVCDKPDVRCGSFRELMNYLNSQK